MTAPDHACWCEPDESQALQGSALFTERGIGIGATIAVHLAVGLLFLQHLAGDNVVIPKISSRHGLSIFSVPEISATDDTYPAELTPRRVVADTAPLLRTMIKPVKPAAVVFPAATQNIGRRGAKFLDPFAVAGLANPVTGSNDVPAAIPVVRSTIPDLDVQVLLAAIQQVRQRFPDNDGTAILRCRISADGRIIEAVFLGGSIGQESGAVLAGLLVGQPLYPKTVTEGIRTALLGPFSVPLTTEEAL